MTPTTKINDMQVYTNFRVDRHPGIIVVWQVGTNKLHLMRVTPKGSFKMRTKTSRHYTTADGAYKGATKWFALLDKVYATASETANAE